MKRFFAAITALCLSAAPASAALVDFSFSGDFSSELSFAGRIRYDDGLFGNSGGTSAQYYVVPMTLDLTVGDAVFSAKVASDVVVRDNLSGADQFLAFFNIPVGNFYLYFVDSTGAALSGLGLPTLGEVLAFPAPVASFNGVIDSIAYGFSDTPVTTIGATFPAPVPEPASWAMLLAGFGLLGTALRRRPKVVAA